MSRPGTTGHTFTRKINKLKAEETVAEAKDKVDTAQAGFDRTSPGSSARNKAEIKLLEAKREHAEAKRKARARNGSKKSKDPVSAAADAVTGVIRKLFN